jgi:REP element-mobilizing transposase RayT
MNRGLEKRRIFPNERANQHFVELVSKMSARFGLKIHAYVLMGNHYHLQVETPRANLSQAIQWLNVSYSVWFNRLNKRVGPLFQGRFKAVLHEPGESALVINRYIHLNPVRVMRLGRHEGRGEAHQSLDRDLIEERVAALNYPWSSYNIYVGQAKNPEWLSTDSIYGFLGDSTRQNSRGTYRRQLEELAAVGDWQADWKDKVSASVLLGSELFVRQMIKRLKGNRHEQSGLRQSERLSLDWQTICGAVGSVWRGDWAELSTRRGNNALPAALYLARNFAGMRLAELGEAAGGVAYPAVSAAIKRFEKRLQVDRNLEKKVKAMRKMLKIQT